MTAVGLVIVSWAGSGAVGPFPFPKAPTSIAAVPSERWADEVRDGLPTPADVRPDGGPTPTWRNITSASTESPPPRDSGGMVYDSTDKYVVLFGGETAGVGIRYYNDTWTFQGGRWSNITSTTAPSPRFGFQFADDPADHAVVLFGGRGAHGGEDYLNDTWEFQAGKWTNVTKPVAPPGRFWGSMSYDNATGTVILFGGNEGLAPADEYTNDTWSFHAGVWTHLTPATSPPGRDDQNQVDDLADQAVFMFGGLNSSGSLNDSWEYAAGAWTQVAPGRGPEDRAGPGLAYDNATGDVVVYGGTPAGTDYYTTWLYHAGSWSAFSLSPTPPAGTIWGQMTYDARDGYVLLFQGNGEYNSTWNLTLTPGTSGPPLSVVASVQPTEGNVPLEVTAKATASGGTGPYTYAWRFGDGNSSALGNTTYSYERVGTFKVNLTVNDSARHSVNESWTVTVQKASSSSTSSSPPIDLYVGGSVLVALAILLALIFVARRRRKQQPPPPGQGATPGSSAPSTPPPS